MDNNLKFIDTLTVEQFKTQQLVKEIQVRKNPHTSKLFFTYGGKTGAVSTKGIPTHPMISLVEDNEGARFYLLHEEGQGGAPVLATF